ncbi:uncharacterized protein N7459_001147 [Penicillium hispanicum]|uniref:uncharacterized protein n=1 Tax=Penicillium hispanicum TaxID=1080232 RepID=UPI00253F746A|nr:uncharacterized protein N7459_001147 [Penicillium hispanicum]KAJ5594939.1 hypothetical protein N7459_001147 [Penicillium hispanicum]
MASFPPPNAGPSQIRDYLVRILTLKHDTTTNLAQQIADLWQLGRGVDFRQATLDYTDESFRRVFGDATGPFLYQSAREDCIAQWRASTAGTLNRWALVGFPVLGVFLFIRAWHQPSGDRAQRALGDAWWALGPPLLISGFFEVDYSAVVSGVAMGIGLFATMCAVACSISNSDHRWQSSTEKATWEKRLV